MTQEIWQWCVIVICNHLLLVHLLYVYLCSHWQPKYHLVVSNEPSSPHPRIQSSPSPDHPHPRQAAATTNPQDRKTIPKYKILIPSPSFMHSHYTFLTTKEWRLAPAGLPRIPSPDWIGLRGTGSDSFHSLLFIPHSCTPRKPIKNKSSLFPFLFFPSIYCIVFIIIIIIGWDIGVFFCTSAMTVMGWEVNLSLFRLRHTDLFHFLPPSITQTFLRKETSNTPYPSLIQSNNEIIKGQSDH